MKCPACSAGNPENSTFCHKCGDRITPGGPGIPSADDTVLSNTSGASPPPAQHENNVGEKLFAGRFEILESIGSGGMGHVYRAVDQRLGEEVALKLLKPEFATQEKTMERFRNELKSARKISHRNVCRSFDIDQAGDTPYITMEYVRGTNLKNMIGIEGGLAPEETVDIMLQVGEGLAEAHRLGVMHRDLKPQNIMIDDSGTVRIMDFGLARSCQVEGLTATGEIMGTPAYMSPEQVQGRETDGRADIYSLGIVLYEMAAGRVPFQGDSAISTAMKHLTENPVDPATLSEKVTPGLGGIILKCLAKDKMDRYQNVAEVLEDLGRHRDGLPISASSQRDSLPGFLTEEAESGEETGKDLFVGREGDIGKLDGFLKSALSGKGQTIFVTGEAGCGKTALVKEFMDIALQKNEGLIVAAGRCNAHTGLGDPYLPFREVLDMLSGDVEATWSAGAVTSDHARRLWKTLPLLSEALVETGPDLLNTFLPGASLLSRARVFAGEPTPWLAALTECVQRKAEAPPDPHLQQSNLFEQYARLLEKIAAKTPLVLVVEDLHWADSGSISLLFHLSRRLRQAPILIIGTFRPVEVSMGRGGERHPLEKVFNELKREFGDFEVEVGAAEGRRFVDDFLDSEPNRLDDKFRGTLYRQTEGHPLFTIELLRDMQDRGMLLRDAKGRWTESEDLDWNSLPRKIDAVIEERMGRLDENLRSVLAVASVEGEEFTAEAVSKLQGMEPRALVQILSKEFEKKHRLVNAVGMKRLNGRRLSTYRFQHILFQKYLYGSLDEAERSYLHEEMGNTLEELYGEHVGEVNLQLAHHYREAGIDVKAIKYLADAGRTAASVSAHAEAAALYGDALALLENLPAGDQRDQQEFALRVALGFALIPIRGYSAPDVGQACARIEELLPAAKDPQLRYMALTVLNTYHQLRAEFRLCLGVQKGQKAMADQSGSPVLLALNHASRGNTILHMGKYREALDNLNHMIDFYNPADEHWVPHRRSQDVGTLAYAFDAWTLWGLGYPDQALEKSRKGIEIAHQIKHPFSEAFALCVAGGGFNYLYAHDVARLKRCVGKMMKIAEDKKFIFYQAWAMFFMGWALTMEGQVGEGIAAMEQGFKILEMIGINLYRCSSFVPGLALAYGKAGKADHGLEILETGIASGDESDETYMKSESFRAKGELLLQKNQVDKAEVCLREAIDIAAAQEARYLELRAANTLASHLVQRGERDEAKSLIIERYGWFTEGFESKAVAEARSILSRLD